MKLKQGTFNRAELKANAPYIDEIVHHSLANDQENSDFVKSTILDINPELGKDDNVNDAANSGVNSWFNHYFGRVYNRNTEQFEYKRWSFNPNDRNKVDIYKNLVIIDGIKVEAFRGEVTMAVEVLNGIDRNISKEKFQ